MFAVPISLWIFFVAASALVLVPVFRLFKKRSGARNTSDGDARDGNTSDGDASERRALNLIHARTLDRLSADLDLEAEIGRMSALDAADAKIRMERRLVNALKQHPGTGQGSGQVGEQGDGGGDEPGRFNPVFPVVLVALCLCTAFGYYVLVKGQPQFRDLPFSARQDLGLPVGVTDLQRAQVQLSGKALPLEADRMRGPNAADIADAAQMSDEDRQAMIQSMVDGLAARLKEEPDNFAGWQRLARAQRVLNNTDGQKDALRNMTRLQPDDAAAAKSLLRLLVSDIGPQRELTAEMKALVEKIVRIDPDDVEGLFFSGVIAFRAGQEEQAAALWDRTLARIPADHPVYRQLEAEIGRLKSE